LDEDWSLHKPLFELFKCELLSVVPVPGLVLLGEIVERASEVGEIPNEAPIKTTKTEEGSNVFEFGQGRPVLESLQLDGIHFDSSGA